MFARSALIKTFKSPQVGRRCVSTVAFVKTHTPIIGLSAVAIAAIIMAPPHDFDDLDCQNHIYHHIDDPDHPFHYYPNVYKENNECIA